MSAAPKCANCGDSGRNPGSEYLDCTRCDAATQHAELGKFLASNYADPDCAWKVHQRAYAMGVAAESERRLAELLKCAHDTIIYGTGFMRDGEHIPLSDVYKAEEE